METVNGKELTRAVAMERRMVTMMVIGMGLTRASRWVSLMAVVREKR
jgi:hypothetical protein